MLVEGIRAALGALGAVKVADTGLELPTSIVIAPGGRIEEPTTSARDKFRVPCAKAREVSI
jgi:hypothetical protein